MEIRNQLSKEELLSQFAVREEDLVTLCRAKKVRYLAIFGSAVRGKFKVNQSDLDFLVEFEVISVDLFFEFLEELKNLFNYQKIDLITLASVKNQVIREEILSSREELYAA
jgi:predicted nucleotidyltransferase